MTHDLTRRNLIAATALAGASSSIAGPFGGTAWARATDKKQENIMKTDVSFTSSGLRIASQLYVPDNLDTGKQPAIIIGHMASGVKEQSPAIYARHLAEQGFIALTFDTGTQGESGGKPRGLEDPNRRVEEFKDAVSFLGTHDKVDPDRIGLLGICASGGYVVAAASGDHRVKAVTTVSGVDLGSIYRLGGDGKQDPKVFQGMLDSAAAARTAEANGDGVGYLPVFTTKEAAIAAGPFMAEGWDYYKTPRGQHPRSADKFTWTSVDMLANFDGFQFANLIAPRALLVVVGRQAVTAGNSMRAFEKANEPKEAFWIDGATYQGLYDKPEYVNPAVAKLGDFFRANLAV